MDSHAKNSISGGIPLDEFSRNVPPGWAPNLSNYPLRSYFDKLRLWDKVHGVEDDQVGPLIASRLKGQAQKLALRLRIPKVLPDGTIDHDVGVEALSRAEAAAVTDQAGNVILAEQPSGSQLLLKKLQETYGLAEHDQQTEALDLFFNLKRTGSMTLQEYCAEFDVRYEAAEDKANLQINQVCKSYLLLKQSNLSEKHIDDIKLQLQGDLSQYMQLRTLILRLAKAQGSDNPVYLAEQTVDDDDQWPTDDPWAEEVWYDDDEYHSYYIGDEEDWDDTWDADWWTDEQDWEPDNDDAEQEDQEVPDPQALYDSVYWKGKGGGKGKTRSCSICGSKFHGDQECPIGSQGKGDSSSPQNHSGKNSWSHYGKGGYGKGRYGKGKGKTKGKFGKNKGKRRWKGYGKGYPRQYPGKGKPQRQRYDLFGAFRSSPSSSSSVAQPTPLASSSALKSSFSVPEIGKKKNVSFADQQSSEPSTNAGNTTRGRLFFFTHYKNTQTYTCFGVPQKTSVFDVASEDLKTITCSTSVVVSNGLDFWWTMVLHQDC